MTTQPQRRRGLAPRRRPWGTPGSIVLAVLVLLTLTSAADARHPRNAAAAAAAATPTFASISNGTIRLGVNPEGHLDGLVDDGEPLGLEYLPTGAEGLSNGCWCEGWGVMDRVAGVAGWASVANGGVSSTLVPTGFDVTAETATSTVQLGGNLRIRHVYRPSAWPDLYELDLTVENIGSTAADIVYRRAMDWDVPPTEFDEFVTIAGSHPRLLEATDNGFNHVDPRVPLTDLGARGTFEDIGPDDRGAVFDFALGTIAPGEQAGLTMFYGASPSEAGALSALAGVGAQLYSLGQSNTPDGPTLGTPTTFAFGVADDVVESGPVIATGRLVIPKGGEEPPPISGSIALYLPNLDGAARSEDTLVATTTTALDGTFTLRADSSQALEAAAAANDGQINLDLVANVNGWVYHESVIRAVVGGSWVEENGLTPPDIVILPTGSTVDMRLVPGAAAGATSGSQAYGSCVTYRFPLASARAWTTIGELHTPADTEVATFTYGRKADSYIAKAFSLDGSFWVVKGTVRVANETGSSSSATIAYSTTRDRWAHEIQTEFVYTKYRTELWCASPAAVKVSEAYEIRATKWVGSSRLGRDLTHLDDRCAEDHAQYLTPFGKGFTFTRDENRYGTFTNAASVTVGGTTLSVNARSGLSRWVVVDWRFGSKSTRHVLCGIDAFPPTTTRIFAGA